MVVVVRVVALMIVVMVVVMIVVTVPMAPGIPAVTGGMLVLFRPVAHGQDPTPDARHQKPSCRPPTITPRKTSWCVM